MARRIGRSEATLWRNGIRSAGNLDSAQILTLKNALGVIFQDTPALLCELDKHGQVVKCYCQEQEYLTEHIKFLFDQCNARVLPVQIAAEIRAAIQAVLLHGYSQGRQLVLPYHGSEICFEFTVMAKQIAEPSGYMVFISRYYPEY